MFISRVGSPRTFKKGNKMVHSYKTTHDRHDLTHGLRFSLSALTFIAIIGAFSIHWVFGLISIIPCVFIFGLLDALLDTKVTYSFLRKDCGVDITWDEAKKYRDYFSPNETGKWIDARFLIRLPEETRLDALFYLIESFDKDIGKPDGTKDEDLSGVQDNVSIELPFECEACKRWLLWVHLDCQFKVDTDGIVFTDKENQKYSFEVTPQRLREVKFDYPQGKFASTDDLRLILTDGREYVVGFDPGLRAKVVSAIKTLLEKQSLERPERPGSERPGSGLHFEHFD